MMIDREQATQSPMWTGTGPLDARELWAPDASGAGPP